MPRAAQGIGIGDQVLQQEHPDGKDASKRVQLMPEIGIAEAAFLFVVSFDTGVLLP